MKRGYSLVELIVVVTIMLLLIVGVLVGYTSYTDSQRERQTALNIKTLFKTAQTKASAGNQADFCDVYTDPLGYYVVTLNSTGYTLDAVCSVSNVSQTILSEKFPTGYTITNTVIRYYPSISQPTSLNVDTQISVRLGTTAPIVFTVSKNGTVIDN